MRITVRGKTGIVNIARAPHKPKWDEDVTKREATRAWIAGYMQEARKKPAKYRSVNRLKFTFNGIKEYRKI